MDREFIIKNQIVERYLAGRLPPKGVTDFEKLIRSRPQLIEELGLPDRVNAGLRLLDAAGIAEPWAEKPKKLWERPAFTFAAAGVAIAAIIGCLALAMQVSSRDTTIAKLKQAGFATGLSEITWDDDEEFTWEMLNGNVDDVELSIELGNVQSIARHSSGATVTLHDGRSFELRGSNDLDDGNRGIRIRTDGREYEVDWRDFAEVTLGR